MPAAPDLSRGKWPYGQRLRKRSISLPLFLLLVLYNCWPLMVGEYYPATDAPAHLYNAQILSELIFGGDSEIYQHFFSINPEPVPNWSGHFILMLFLQMGLAPLWAEKVLLLLMAIALPYSIYQLLKNHFSGQEVWALLSLPLLYNMLFGMGFYNFTFGLIFLFISINTILNLKYANVRSFIKIFLLMAVLYFSHLFCFIMLMIFVVIRGIGLMRRDRDLLKILGIHSIAAIPFLTMAAYFILNRPTGGPEGYLGLEVLWQMLYKLEILKFFHLPELTTFNQFINLAFAIGLILSIWYGRKSITGYHFLFIILAGTSLILFLVMPDVSSNGSYISVRLLLVFYLILIPLLASLKPFSQLAWPVVVVVLVLHSQRLNIIHEELQVRAQKAQEYLNLLEQVEQASVVMVEGDRLGYYDNHFHNYLGLKEKVIVLRNYEADYGYFPVVWDEGFEPEDRLKAADFILRRGQEGENPELVKILE